MAYSTLIWRLEAGDSLTSKLNEVAGVASVTRVTELLWNDKVDMASSSVMVKVALSGVPRR